jgi:hypothetical protein
MVANISASVSTIYCPILAETCSMRHDRLSG